MRLEVRQAPSLAVALVKPYFTCLKPNGILEVMEM